MLTHTTDSNPGEEYLTTIELSSRIKMAPGTIRNLIWKKEFTEGTHYLKPTPKKVLFIWSAVEAWLYGKSPSVATADNPYPISRINI